MLAPSAAAAAFHVTHLASVGSTMDAALQCAQQGETGRLWIVADEQTAGRGRQGRQWVSAKGNLYASLLLIDPCPAAQAPQLGFVAGLALHDALSQLCGQAYSVKLKWPNDVLVDGAKISGILLEGTQLTGQSCAGQQAVIIGIGVNIAHHPPVAAYPTTSLHALGLQTSVADLFAALSGAMAMRLGQWARGENFASIRVDWMASAGGIGTTVEVRQDQTVLQGLFQEIDGHGRMVLMLDGQPKLIHAGDVYLNRNT